jgi:hypothetical protein
MEASRVWELRCEASFEVRVALVMNLPGARSEPSSLAAVKRGPRFVSPLGRFEDIQQNEVSSQRQNPVGTGSNWKLTPKAFAKYAEGVRKLTPRRVKRWVHWEVLKYFRETSEGALTCGFQVNPNSFRSLRSIGYSASTNRTRRFQSLLIVFGYTKARQ